MITFLPYNAVIFVEEVTYMIALDAFHHFPDMKIVPGIIMGIRIFSARYNYGYKNCQLK